MLVHIGGQCYYTMRGQSTLSLRMTQGFITSAQWVPDVQVLLSLGRYGFGGCKISSQCSDQAHLESLPSVPFGGSELLF